MNSVRVSWVSAAISSGIGLTVPAGEVELPDAEVVLEDDGLAVAADSGEADIAAGESRHLLGVAAGLAHAPDIGLALAFAVAHEVDEAVPAPERPRVHSVETGHVLESLGGQVHDGDVALIGAAVILAPVRLGLAVDGQLGTVRRERAGDSHVGPGIAGQAAVDRDHIELAHEIFAALAGEKDSLAVGCPVEHGLVGRVNRQALDGPAGGGNQIDVHVSLAIGGKRDRSSIRREPRMDVARRVDGEPLNVLAVFVGGPDVAEISESDLAGVIIGIAHQFRLAGRGKALERRRGGSGKRRQISSWMSFRLKQMRTGSPRRWLFGRHGN